MNYIKQLQADNKALRAQLTAGLESLAGFRTFLHSPKFSGVESDGGRKDWIATGDVLAQLSNVRDALTDEPVVEAPAPTLAGPAPSHTCWSGPRETCPVCQGRP